MGYLADEMQRIIEEEDAKKAAISDSINAVFPKPKPHVLHLDAEEIPQPKILAHIALPVPDSFHRKR